MDPNEQAAESIILLINKLIFARTIEDFGLVPTALHRTNTPARPPLGSQRPTTCCPKFLTEFEDSSTNTTTPKFFRGIWERLDKTHPTPALCDKLNFVLGIMSGTRRPAVASSTTNLFFFF